MLIIENLMSTVESIKSSETMQVLQINELHGWYSGVDIIVVMLYLCMYPWCKCLGDVE